jgi:hydroxyethylthiazole kinase-like uncharacterized protein yjeF
MSSALLTEEDDLPVLSGDEARDIDLQVTEQLGRVRVLECVATRIADCLHYHLDIAQTTPLLFVAGKGNNGANCLAAARILHFRGWREISLVTLFDPISNPENNPLRPNTAEQLELFRSFVGSDQLHPLDLKRVEEFGVIVDGILGTGISNPPRGVAALAIEAINANTSSDKKRVLAIDVPSGLNHMTGEAPGVCVESTWTLNLHMLKSGQLEPVAKPYIGELWSAETALGFTSFPGLETKFRSFYEKGPIRKVFSSLSPE